MFTPTPGATVAGRFELRREIGRGGMGSVWECFDTDLQAPCALKFILDDFAANEALRARFFREARAVAQLQSPHCVSVWSVGDWEGCLYIAMELLRGESLQQRLERAGRLDVALTREVVEQVALVLERAHALQIVHRDLKPDNIWLWEGPRTFVKVLDFGVAKHVTALEGPRTATGAMVGTPYYMSPEQASGNRSVDHRADLWALSVIAIECLSGRRPFDSDGLGDLLLQIMERPVPRLLQLGIDAGPTLQAWWEIATSRPVDQRFQSAAALSAAFVRATSDAFSRSNVGDPAPVGGRTVVVAAPAVGNTDAQVSGVNRVGSSAVGSSAVGSSAVGSSTVEPLSRTHSTSSVGSTSKPLLWLAAAVAVAGLVTLVLLFSREDGAGEPLEGAAASGDVEALEPAAPAPPAGDPGGGADLAEQVTNEPAPEPAGSGSEGRPPTPGGRAPEPEAVQPEPKRLPKRSPAPEPLEPSLPPRPKPPRVAPTAPSPPAATRPSARDRVGF